MLNIDTEIISSDILAFSIALWSIKITDKQPSVKKLFKPLPNKSYKILVYNCIGDAWQCPTRAAAFTYSRSNAVRNLLSKYNLHNKKETKCPMTCCFYNCTHTLIVYKLWLYTYRPWKKKKILSKSKTFVILKTISIHKDLTHDR